MASSDAGIVCLILVLCSAVPSLAIVHTVGDSGGWALSVDYSTWAGGKTFTVGDSLVFNYGSSHTVDEVSASDYGTCSVGNSISSDNSGATTIPLKTAGKHYFICGVIGHCSGGMKLEVTVTSGGSGGGGGSTTTPSASTPPSSTGSSTSPATPSGAVPASSSAGILSPLVAALFTFALFLVKLVIS